MCTRALPLVKCTRPLADSILLSCLTLSLSISPSRVRPILPLFLYYTHLASVKQTHQQSPTLPSLQPAHPTTPPPSRLHTAWRYPSSTIRLNLVNHSHFKLSSRRAWDGCPCREDQVTESVTARHSSHLHTMSAKLWHPSEEMRTGRNDRSSRVLIGSRGNAF